MADITTNPEMTDVNLANTADFLKAFTDYNEHLSKFAAQISLASIFKYTDITVDPVTDKAKLFESLTKGTLSVSTDNRGGLDKKSNKTKVPPAVNSAKLGFNNDGGTGLDDDFLSYWLEKYRVLHPQIQLECEKLLPGSSNIYFKDISESIGCLTEVDFINDDRVLPYFDTTITQYDPPVVYNGKIHNKLTSNTQLISLKMSKLLNVNSRTNLINIINGPNSHKLVKNSSDESHGNNLITDFGHRNRMNKIVTELVSILQQQYQDLWRVVELLTTKENISSQKFKKVKLDVETVKIEVDILKNKLYKTKKEQTNNCVLSVDCEDKKTRLARQAKEKAEDAATAAKRKATLLQKIKEMIGLG